jgi:hypothetical protein
MYSLAKSQNDKCKSRKRFRCLGGWTLLFASIFFITIIVTFLLCRKIPPVEENIFYSQELCAFFRIHSDTLISPSSKPLVQQILNNLKKNSVKDKSIIDAGNGIDAGNVINILKLVLHRNHYLMYYRGWDDVDDFLLFIGIKRMSWIIKASIDEDNLGLKRVPSDPGIDADIFYMKSRDIPLFFAISRNAVLVSNTKRRLFNGLRIIEKSLPGHLSSFSRDLLPTDKDGDLLNGFSAWDKNWALNIGEMLYKKDSHYHEIATPFLDYLYKYPPQAFGFRIQLLSSQSMKMLMDIRCKGRNDASSMAAVFNKYIASQSSDLNVSSKGDSIIAEAVVPLMINNFMKNK